MSKPDQGDRERRTRRQVLTGAAGVLGALAATSIVRATPASANTGDSLTLGKDNSASTQTSILNNSQTTIPFTQLYVGSGWGTGIYGQSGNMEGVHGKGISSGVIGEGGNTGVTGTGTKVGVMGTTAGAEGVYGQHGSGGNGPSTSSGVHGVTDSATDSGVLGENLSGGTGVSGSSSGIGVQGSSSGSIGVSGTSAGNQAGVQGISLSGNGVHGVSNDLNGVGIGVLGEQQGAAGTGVVGVGTTGVEGRSIVPGQSGVIGRGTYGVSAIPLSGGTGLFATYAYDGTGLALEAYGPAKFDAQILAARSGIASIAYPNKAATVAVGGLSASSLVLATMQNTVAGISVVSAVPNTGTGKVSINLNKAPGSATRPLTAKVAWFVVN